MLKRILLNNDGNIPVSHLPELIANALYPDGVQLISDHFFNINLNEDKVPLVSDEPYMMRHLHKKTAQEDIRKWFINGELQLICPIRQRTVLRSELDNTNPFDCLISPSEFKKIAEIYGIRIEVTNSGVNNKIESRINDRPWLIADPHDPEPEQDWYVAARYFARQLVVEDSTLLLKRKLLASNVSQSLSAVNINKRGGKFPLNPATVLKAFNNIKFY